MRHSSGDALSKHVPSRRHAAPADPAPTALIHEAFFYRNLTEYVRGVGEFVDGGLDAGEPVMVAVPGSRLDLIRARFGRDSRVQFANMIEIGRNPARIIPRIQAFVDQHAGSRVRFVGEPIWAGRRPREAVEGTRHEALINLAFAAAPATIFCPYDVAGLDEDVLKHAECTHPIVLTVGQRRASDSFTDPVTVYDAVDLPLPAPPPSAAVLSYGADLSDVRSFVRQEVARAGLGAERTEELLVASNEAVTNTIVHVGRPGKLKIWRDGDEVICEIADAGHVSNPLVGRVLPSDEHIGGRGLWLVNQLCDLVELRSSRAGTVVRLHMSLDQIA